MRDVPAIIYTATDRDAAVRAVEDQWHRVRFVEQREAKTEAKAGEIRAAADKAQGVFVKAKEEADAERTELGRRLIAARATFPKSGSRKGDPFAQSWSAWLESIGLTQQRAHELMQRAGYKEEAPPPNMDPGGTSSNKTTASDPPTPTPQSPLPASSSPAVATPADRSGGRGKPQWLMRALVQDYSLPGDLVCDPLAGWGSTLRAALDTGRRAIGGEIDPKIAAEAGELPIHVGPWQESLAHVDRVDAVICDPPYSKRTHEASRKFGNEREDGSSLEGLGPEYAAWTRDHVFEFVRSWAPRNRGWFVALTDHNLIHDWQDAYEEAGLYSFAPVICLIRGMTVRLCGDGPSSWAIYAMVARPLSFSRWRTLTGGYVGSRDKLEIGDAA